jgi:hypothetical protein
MRLRMTASILTVLCTWVLWEKWIAHSEGEPTARLVQAVLETSTLSECRAAAPGFAKERADRFRGAYKEPDYTVLSNESSAMLLYKNGKKTPQQYVFYCLPPTVDPYQDPR